MNNGKTTVAISFVAGAVAASLAAYFLLRPALPSVQALRCDVQPNEFLSISGFAVKILDADVKLPKPRRGDAVQPRMASLQWRCDVKNLSAVALRFDLKAELLDADGFVLGTGAVDSNHGQGDLAPGQVQTVHDDLLLDYSKARHLASARITPKALKTDSQMQQERQAQLTQQMAEIERKGAQRIAELERQRKAGQQEREQEEQERVKRAQLAQAEQQKQIDEERKKWKELRQGMSKPDVQALFGKPLTVRSFGSAGDWWEYPKVEGSYTTPRVDFNVNGAVEGWRAP